MAKPPSFGSRDTVAVVSIFVAVNPAPPRIMENAMEKQPACAAPMSSSGLVPCSPSNRVLKEYGFADKAPEPVESVPEPSLRVPCQTADAFCFMAAVFRSHAPQQTGIS